jgi:very-short-patch-repair endonuclease
MALDRTALDLAASQGGVITRLQLLRGGRSSSWIEREVSAGRLVRIKNGVYRAIDLRQHQDLMRAAAVALPNPVVSHESAAHLLRFPALPPLRPTVTVHSKTTHTFPGLTVRRTSDLKASHIIRIEGLSVTNLPRTVFDLAAVLDESLLDEIIESLVLAGRLQLLNLAAFAETLRRRGKPGCSIIMAILERRLVANSTKLERLGLKVLRDGGVPEPVVQYPAPWNERERIDAAWPSARAGVEWDSKAWHSSKDRMANDRRRDRRASLAGWAILRYTWVDLHTNPDAVATEILRLLAIRS